MTELLDAVAALEDIAAGDMTRESMIHRAKEALGDVPDDEEDDDEDDPGEALPVGAARLALLRPLWESTDAAIGDPHDYDLMAKDGDLL